MPRPRPLSAWLIIAAALAGAAATPAVAGQPRADAATRTTASSGHELAARADGIADETVARWAALQRPDARFPDPVAGSGEDYGTAMLGLAIARRAAERGDRELLRRGLAAVLTLVERPTGGAFEPLVLADTYRWGQGTLAARADLRDLWAPVAARLSADLTARPAAGEGTVAARCLADPACWNNLKLVGALAGGLLLRSGLTSQTPGALLADPALPGAIDATLAQRIPTETGASVSRRGAAALQGAGLLSDPTRDPLAYHALSTALLGRLAELTADATPPAAREALDRASRGLLALVAPNGDLTWWGRGQGQVWVPAMVAEAAARAARRAPLNGDLRGRYLAVAAAALAHLRNAYGVGAIGMPLVPGAVDGAILRARRVDSYATTRGYNGLAVDALDRAAAILAGIGTPATSVPATRDGAVRSPRQAGLATITRAGRWVAIAARSRAIEDARYAAGLVGLQARGADGAWTPRIPARPYADASAATLAVRSGGSLLAANGTLIVEPASDRVRVIGRWGRPGRGATVDEGTVWTWRLRPDGTLAVSFGARRDRTVVATALAGDGAIIRRTLDGVDVRSPDETLVRYALRVNGRTVPLARTRRVLGGSAYDAAVRALDLAARVRAGAQVTLTVRAIGAPPVAGG